MNIDLIMTGIEQGLILVLVAYAVMIPFRLLNLPDLSVEGAYPLGGAVSAAALLMGVPASIALMLGAICGATLGMLTATVHKYLNVNTLLAGIILSTMAYSVSLRLMTVPNLSLFGCIKIFDSMSGIPAYRGLFLMLIIVSCLLPFIYFLFTCEGLRFRAIGHNLRFAHRLGMPVVFYTIAGFGFAGFLSGLSGGLMVQLQGYMDIGMGVGIVIHGLAAVMLGEIICNAQQSFMRQLLAPLAGALCYQQIQGLALTLGLMPSDLKFFTGGLVLIVLCCSRCRLAERVC